MATLVAGAAVVVLYASFDPEPAGADADIADLVPMPSIDPLLLAQELEPDDSESIDSEDKQRALDAGRASGRLALLVNLLLIEKGTAFLEGVTTYSAKFFKRERLDGELGDGQLVHFKIRHAPFSVYMKWIVGDKGRELLYVDGANDGKMIVQIGGLKGRFLPSLKLDPNGSLAMKESRHPITKAGLLTLSHELVAHRRRDLELTGEDVRCQMLDDQRFDDRDCYCFVIEWKTREAGGDYRKSISYIDKEWSIPVSVQNFCWPHDDSETTDARQLDDETLIEHYSYSEIDFGVQLADADFDRGNKRYRFRR